MSAPTSRINAYTRRRSRPGLGPRAAVAVLLAVRVTTLTGSADPPATTATTRQPLAVPRDPRRPGWSGRARAAMMAMFALIIAVSITSPAAQTPAFGAASGQVTGIGGKHLAGQGAGAAHGNPVWCHVRGAGPAQRGRVSTSPPDPSGQLMPVGNLPGWTQVFADDFTKD